MRVLGRGGGTGRPRGRPGRGCLAQRGELERRVNGAPHQLAERALGRATGDRRGEHAFVKLRRRSDGNGSLQAILQRLLASPQRLRGRPESCARRRPVGSPPWAAPTPTACASATANATPQASSSTPNYFVYYDLALTELWRDAAGGYGAMMEEGVDLQVVEATARYKAPARFDDEIDVTIEVTQAGHHEHAHERRDPSRRHAARRARARLRLRRRHRADEGPDPRAVPGGASRA